MTFITISGGLAMASRLNSAPVVFMIDRPIMISFPVADPPPIVSFLGFFLAAAIMSWIDL
jgi:hypothetical protein